MMKVTVVVVAAVAFSVEFHLTVNIPLQKESGNHKYMV
jgi:hypothetical protein